MSATIESRAAILRGSKFHLSINTDQLAETVEFYRRLFGAEPVKHYHDYAKFDLDQPGLNLAINRKDSVEIRSGEHDRPVNHFGIELATSEQVSKAISALQAGGFETHVEQEVSCCYGVQDKVWVRDPNGHQWEIFAVLVGDTGPTGSACSTTTSAGGACATTANTSATAAQSAKPTAVPQADQPSACCVPSAKPIASASR